MKEFEAGRERLQRTKDRIDFRTTQAVGEMIANDTGAGVVAAGSDDIKVLAESADLSRNSVQPNTEMRMVQLQDGARQNTDKIFRFPERYPATKRRSQNDLDDGPK